MRSRFSKCFIICVILIVGSSVTNAQDVDFEKFVYDNLELTKVKGKLLIKNQVLTIQNLESEIVGGERR